MLTPAHPRPPLQDINDAFERAMVMRARLGIGMDMDRAGPDLLRPDPGEIDRGRAVHAGSLRRVGIELIARDHLDAVGFPVDPFWLLAHRACSENPLLRVIWSLGGVSRDRYTAIDRQYLTCDHARIVARQIERHPGDVLRLDQPQ